MKLSSSAAKLAPFSPIKGGIAWRGCEIIGERTVPEHSRQNLQISETSGHCVIEEHLAQMGRISHYMRSFLIIIFSAVLICGIPTHAQGRIDPTLLPEPLTPTGTLFIFSGVDQSNALEDAQQNPTPSNNSASAPPPGSGNVAGADQEPSPQDKQDDSKGKQTKRLLWVVPNFAAVNANTQLPPMSTREKFVLAARDSVLDYSSYTWAAVLAEQAMLLNSDPELGHGIAGYGRYYWRTFTDEMSGTFFTEAIVPSIAHEDPRYYTMEQGGFFRRTGYAISRAFLTKTDSGRVRFNFSEVVGNALEAGLSNAYYPPQERGLSQTATNWGTQMESAVLNHIFQEFWPDIRRKVFRRK
jgi:hypothetical protein